MIAILSLDHIYVNPTTTVAEVGAATIAEDECRRAPLVLPSPIPMYMISLICIGKCTNPLGHMLLPGLASFARSH